MEKTKNIKNKWLHLRLDEAEHRQLVKQFSRTTETHLSKYARKILLGKPMIARTRDESLKDIIVVLTRLQKDLNGVGNNYNQMLHKLHIMDEYEEIKAWVISYELEKRSLFESIEIMKGFIAKTSERWLR
ncbi:MAG TPA: plasmid mobilization relaxosome protein MobC [Anseongella sp.]